MVPWERGKESKIFLGIKALWASVYGAYNMFAEKKSADEI